MIFSGELADKVLAGAKTQTRRPAVLAGEPWDESTVWPCRYVVGRAYAVQRKRATHAVGRILILGVSFCPSTTISDEDARAEGFDSPDAFYERWESFYGDGKPWCWRLEFELAIDGEQPRTPTAAEPQSPASAPGPEGGS